MWVLGSNSVLELALVVEEVVTEEGVERAGGAAGDLVSTFMSCKASSELHDAVFEHFVERCITHGPTVKWGESEVGR